MSDRGHVLRMAGGEQRLKSVPGTEVERPLDRGPHREPREHPGRRRDAEHVVGPRELVLERVARDQQRFGRNELDGGGDVPVVPLEHAHLLEAPDEARQRLLGVGRRDVEIEEEQLDQRREPTTPGEHVQVERQLGRVPAARDLGRERLAHRVRRVPGLDERGAKERDPLVIVDPRPVARASRTHPRNPLPGHCASIVRHVRSR